MADRPILFSGPMVRALLDGRKTQTRRVLSPQPNMLNGGKPLNDGHGAYSTDAGWKRYRISQGDRLYVREEYSFDHSWSGVPPRDVIPAASVWYWADGNPSDGDWTKPKPGMHMPRWASRLALTVINVRVQRLQDIGHVDAAAEGCLGKGAYPGGYDITPRDQFRDLWDSLNAARGFGWDANPWVIAVSFTVEHRNINAKPEPAPTPALPVR